MAARLSKEIIMKVKTLLLGGLALSAVMTTGMARADGDWGARVYVPAPSVSIGYWDRGSGLSFGINSGPAYYGRYAPPPVVYYAPPPRVYYGAPVYYGPPGHWRRDYREHWHGRGDDHRGWGHRGRWGDDD